MSATAIDAPTSRQHPLTYLRDHLAVLDGDSTALQTWASRHECLTGFTSALEVIRFSHSTLGGRKAIDTDRARAEEILHALIREHVDGDQQATLMCLLLAYPILASSVRAHEDDLASYLVAALIAALPRCLTKSGPAYLQLHWAVRTELRKRTTRTPVVDLRTAPIDVFEESHQPLGHLRQQEIDDASSQVWGLLLDAHASRVISLQEAQLLLEVHGLDPQHEDITYPAVARRHAIGESALRQRISRAMRRLRAAVDAGTLVRP